MSTEAYLCTSENMHPYECDGKGKCRHCDRAHVGGHRPSECAFCEEDCLAGNVSVYSFVHVHPPADASEEFAAGWEAAMAFADAHGDGPYCRVKDDKGFGKSGLLCVRPFNHPEKSHEGHWDHGGVAYWPEAE